MIFEHFALNLAAVNDVVEWYTTNIGLKIMSNQQEPPFMTFLGDSSGRVVLELYHRPDQKITDFKGQHPLTFHVAFVSEDARTDMERLMKAGATFEEEVNKEDGSVLIMLRDPWGIPLQLCQRNRKF
ncbi:MAG: VOC family protein [Eudoraea sp.]|nr:VOC family protein [Eudoraea sp.]